MMYAHTKPHWIPYAVSLLSVRKSYKSPSRPMDWKQYRLQLRERNICAMGYQRVAAGEVLGERLRCREN